MPTASSFWVTVDLSISLEVKVIFIGQNNDLNKDTSIVHGHVALFYNNERES